MEYPEFRCEVQDPVNQQEVQERCADVRKLRNIAAAKIAVGKVKAHSGHAR